MGIPFVSLFPSVPYSLFTTPRSTWLVDWGRDFDWPGGDRETGSRVCGSRDGRRGDRLSMSNAVSENGRRPRRRHNSGDPDCIAGLWMADPHNRVEIAGRRLPSVLHAPAVVAHLLQRSSDGARSTALFVRANA